MSHSWLYETNKTIEKGQTMQLCYSRLLKKAPNPETKSIIRDLLCIERMNEILLRRIQEKI